MKPGSILLAMLAILICHSGCRSQTDHADWTIETFNQRFWHGDCNASNISVSDKSLFFAGGYSWDDLVYLWNADAKMGTVNWKHGPYDWAYGIYSDDKIIAYVVKTRGVARYLEVLDSQTGEVLTDLSTEVTKTPRFLKPELWIVPRRTKSSKFEGWNIHRPDKRLFSSSGKLGYGGATSESRFYSASLDGVLRAFSLSDGKVIYEKPIAESITTEVTIVGPMIVFGIREGKKGFLVGVDKNEGKEKWRKQTPDIISTHVGSIASDESQVYTTANYKARGIGIRAIDPTNGKILWKRKAPVNGSIAVTKHGITLAARDKLYVFNPSTGEVSFERDLSDDAVISPPAATDDFIYVATIDCKLHAFKIETPN